MNEPWAERAACRDMPPSLFHVPDYVPDDIAAEFENEALAVCSTCPVKVSCLDWAIDNEEEYGVLGGTRERERRSMIRRRMRGGVR